MIRRLVVLVAALGLAFPAGAAAADTTINFSGFPENTVIHDQYLAGSGVKFGGASTFGFPSPPPLLNCGSPYIDGDGLNGPALGIACRTGSNEFPDRRFATAIEFNSEQRRIRFNIVNRTGHTQTAVTKFYAIGSSTPLTTITTALTPNAPALVDSTSLASNTIVGVVIQGLEAMDYGDSEGVFIDDLIGTRDSEPPNPKYTLALQTPNVDVVEGSTADASVSVRRYNGSSGDVTLSAGSLPAGVDSTQFIPGAVTGTDPAILRIRADSPFTDTRQLSVSASGGGSAGIGVNTTGLLQTVNGVPAMYFSTGGRFPIRLVPGCGPQRITDSVNVRGDFSGYTSYNFGSSIAGSGLQNLTTTTDGSPFFPSGNGTYPFAYKLDPGAADGGGTFKVVMSPLFATDAEISLNWLSDRLSIISVPTISPALPLVDGGTTVSVIGNFPANCPVTFQDAAGQPWSIRAKDQTEVDGRQRDLYILNVPPTGVSGPLKAVNAAGAVMATSPALNVREFRREYGFQQVNGGSGAKGTYSWADFERTYGTDDTDSCFIVCVHDPRAVSHYDKIKADVEAGTGLCFGYAVMAARFRGYGSGQRFSDYSPTAKRAWDIMPFNDGTAVKRDIVRWFSTQADKPYLKDDERATRESPSGERKLLKDLLAQQGAALVTMTQGTSGHAVTAYAAQDDGAGGLIVSIYDPNIPYMTSEETTAGAHKTALGNSVITIDAAGKWNMPGKGWSGPNNMLGVIGVLPQVNAKLPEEAWYVTLLASADGVAPAAIAQIESRGKNALDTDGGVVDGSGIDLLPPLGGVGDGAPTYNLQKGREYELTVRGTGTGSYGQTLLGGSSATVRGADTKSGQIDHVTVRPGEASLKFATGAKRSSVVYDLVAGSGKVTRTATIAVTAKEGGEDEVELGNGSLRVLHDGAPTTASVTLGSVGEGLPGSVQTAPMTLGRDQRLELKPKSWGQLAGGVRYVVKSKAGKVLRSGTVKLRTSSKVGVGSVKAKRKGTKLTVTGRVTKRGSSPLLVASASIVKGGKVLRRKTATLAGGNVKKGRFSLPITVGSVPGGARVKVDVILLDQAAGLATARRSVSVR